MVDLGSAVSCGQHPSNPSFQARDYASYYTSLALYLLYGKAYYFKPLTLGDVTRTPLAVTCRLYNTFFVDPAQFHI